MRKHFTARGQLLQQDLETTQKKRKTTLDLEPPRDNVNKTHSIFDVVAMSLL
jgi:hypothetical protein